MLHWIESHQALLWWSAAGSLVLFLGTLIAVPFFVARIPDDYFAHEHRHHTQWADQHPVVRILLLVIQNTVGAVLMLSGIAMLALPGQGLLTLLIGLMLTTFPGKYQLERWLIMRRPIRRAVDWLRRKAGRAPLVVWTGEERDGE